MLSASPALLRTAAAAVACLACAATPVLAQSVSIGISNSGGPDPELVEGARALRRGTPSGTHLSSFDHLRVYAVRRPFDVVADDLARAIAGHGLEVAHVYDVAGLLDGAGDITQPAVYHEARTVAVCDMRLAKQLAHQNPHHLVFCPVHVSVYVLADDPYTVRIAFRRPLSKGTTPRTQHLLAELEQLLEQIISEVL